MDRKPFLEPGPGNPVRRIMKRLGNRPHRRHAVRIVYMVAPWRRAGMPVAECAIHLNIAGERTYRGQRWNAPNLYRVLRAGRHAAINAFDPRDPDDECRATCAALWPASNLMEDPHAE